MTTGDAPEGTPPASDPAAQPRIVAMLHQRMVERLTALKPGKAVVDAFVVEVRADRQDHRRLRVRGQMRRAQQREER